MGIPHQSDDSSSEQSGPLADLEYYRDDLTRRVFVETFLGNPVRRSRCEPFVTSVKRSVEIHRVRAGVLIAPRDQAQV